MNRNIMKYFGIAAAAAGTLLAASCDDFLDVQPESAFTAEEIFSSEVETKAMLNSIYTKLCNQNLYGFAFPWQVRTNTDVEMASASSNTVDGRGNEANCFDMRPHWTSLLSIWNQAYQTINYCNDFLENMEASPLFSMEVSPSGPTNMQQMYGEVRVIRAMVYLDLVRTWGDVVFRTKSAQTGDNFYGEGVTDRNVILTTLINDLIEHERFLRYSDEIEEGVERASREYCQGLIGQLALCRGGYSLRPNGGAGEIRRENDWMSYYEIARTYLGKVISERRHTLEGVSFEQFWTNQTNWITQTGGDVIFEVPLMKEQNGNIGYNVGVRIDYDSDKPHAYGQGAANQASFCGMYPFTFDVRDLRMDVTCVPYKYTAELNQEPDFGGNAVAGWGCGKWNKIKMGGALTSSQGSTGINNIRLRYADVLLMYAEVENEITGAPTQAARDALKQVRRRAFAPADQSEMVDTYVDRLAGHDEFFEALKSERAWEFGGEGIRKYDLARWGIYGKTVRDLYHAFIDWGLRATGSGVRGDVRDRVYYQEVDNPALTGKKMLEFKGIKEYGDAIGDHTGWKYVEYARNWWGEGKNEEEGMMVPCNEVKWSLRGYINYNNASSITGEEPLRYLAPYPADVITTHRGTIKQQYGY